MLALLLAVSVTSAVGAPFYVATDGSDPSGDGSPGNPWATITHALDSVPDGSTVLVQPGTYHGRVRLRGEFAQGVTVRSATPYQARLRHDATVVTCFTGKGITLEGFDIAHDGPGAGGLVIQIQDLIGIPGGSDFVSRITLRDNVIHDSFNNDLLKINNGAGDVSVLGNMFYNQQGSDEHIDINSVTDVVVENNIFFNDFEGSGRGNGNDTGSFVTIKDSNGGDDTNLGSHRVDVRNNVFLNWAGSTGSNFVLIGEDGMPYYEAQDVTVEGNVLIGNSTNVMRSVFGVKGGSDITFQHNTVTGDLPSLAYAMRLNSEGQNLPNRNIHFFDNIWSDPTATMGAENPSRPNDFSDTPPGETESFLLERGLYWNGGAPIPENGGELINYTDDPNGLVADPLLRDVASVVPPRFVPEVGMFAGGSFTIRQAFDKLVTLYGVPRAGSPAIVADGLDRGAIDQGAGVRLAVAAHDVELGPGETATVDLRIHNSGLFAVGDLYIAIVLPDLDTTLFISGGGGVLGSLSDAATWAPTFSVPLFAPFTIDNGPLPFLTFSGAEPAGRYLLLVAATRANSLADGSIDPGDVLALSFAGVSFTP